MEGNGPTQEYKEKTHAFLYGHGVAKTPYARKAGILKKIEKI